MQYAAKLAVFVITAVLGSNVAAALISQDFSSEVRWGLVVTVLGAVAVFLKANTPQQPEAKKVVALLTVVVLAVVDAATDHHISSAEVAQVALAFFGALQVGYLNNIGDFYHKEVGTPA